MPRVDHITKFSGTKVMVEIECPEFCPADCGPDQIQCTIDYGFEEMDCSEPPMCISAISKKWLSKLLFVNSNGVTEGHAWSFNWKMPGTCFSFKVNQKSMHDTQSNKILVPSYGT